MTIYLLELAQHEKGNQILTENMFLNFDWVDAVDCRATAQFRLRSCCGNQNDYYKELGIK